jgi:glycine oxidase
MPDVIVIGGGVIGLSIAYELAGRDASVRLLEQGGFGQEASWAGAGILPPGNPHGATTPEARLRAGSHVLWPAWSQQLKEETGIDNGFLRCGGLHVANEVPARSASKDSCVGPAELADLLGACQSERVAAEQIASVELRRRFPFFVDSVSSALWLPELGQVRNPRHLKALEAACRMRGVALCPGQPVIGVERSGERILSVRTPTDRFEAGEFVFAGGAWSQGLLQLAGIEFPVEPVRGQIVLLAARPLPFRCVIEQGKRYLVPRSDGRILVGSTEERAGFVKANTAEAIAGLIQFATDLVPALKEASLERMWSGLRPHREGGLPYLGRIEGLKNGAIAAGHFRAGLQLSPITAMIIADELLVAAP